MKSFQQIEDIFHSVVFISDVEQRKKLLDDLCGDDLETRQSVERLLQAHASDGDAATRGFFHSQDSAAKIRVDIDAELIKLLEPSQPPALGKLRHFEILEIIGKGGAGIVVKARDTELGRLVAIKLINPRLSQDAVAVERLIREARAAASISHDHVIEIYGVYASVHPQFICMEYVNGHSLQERVEQLGPFEIEELLRLGIQVADGLHAAHRLGIVHRDIKPANILIEEGLTRAKITDFGIAFAIDDVRLTTTGFLAGTPQYMSPEQARGGQLDSRSDLFSLGAVLYFMSTGKMAFPSESPFEAIGKICSDTPIPVRDLNSKLPPWFEGIVSKLLAKEPGQRFQSAEEVSEVLTKGLEHIGNPKAVRPPKCTPHRERSRLGVRRLLDKVRPMRLLLSSQLAALCAIPVVVTDQFTQEWNSFSFLFLVVFLLVAGSTTIVCAQLRRLGRVTSLFGLAIVSACLLFFGLVTFRMIGSNTIHTGSFRIAFFAFQLVCIPMGLLSLMNTQQQSSQPSRKLVYNLRTLLLWVALIAIFSASLRAVSSIWTGYSPAVAATTMIVTAILGVLGVVGQSLRPEGMARMASTPSRRMLCGTLLMAILSVSATAVSMLFNNQYGQIKLQLSNLPRLPVTTIEERASLRRVICESTMDSRTFSLKKGEYTLIVTSPDYEPKAAFLKIPFEVKEHNTQIFDFDCKNLP